MKTGLLVSLMTAASLAAVIAADEAPAKPAPAKKEQPAPAKAALKPYPLTTCIVSGEKLDVNGEPVVIEYKGRELKFCCNDCIDDFKKDPDKYLKKLDGK